MRTKNFAEDLSKAQDYLQEEEFQKALKVLYRLREIEQKGDFDNSLTHKLYQLISNAESMHNQKIIISFLEDLKKEQDKVNLDELQEVVNAREDIHIKEGILGREIELLILRGVLSAKIQGNELIFKK
ncbi:MAG: hypothetical protein R6U96_13605 [Promethearchaeia archaeon]